jgi:hypothetical protein
MSAEFVVVPLVAAQGLGVIIADNKFNKVPIIGTVSSSCRFRFRRLSP